jgi:hypothetical protein
MEQTHVPEGIFGNIPVFTPDITSAPPDAVSVIVSIAVQAIEGLGAEAQKGSEVHQALVAERDVARAEWVNACAELEKARAGITARDETLAQLRDELDEARLELENAHRDCLSKERDESQRREIVRLRDELATALTELAVVRTELQRRAQYA